MEKSSAEAAFHFAAASLTADGKRPEEREEALRRLNDLGLNAEQVAVAQKRADEWVKLNGG